MPLRLPYLPKRPIAAARRAASAALSPTSPMLAQLVVIRRCNLTCGYCNEYDDFSPPVPTEELFRRVDHLAELGTLVVTLTGGEPLLHPELDRVVERVASHGMVCTSISNAYPITRRWIERLNRAQLSWLQVSVDNIEPNEVSQKSFSKIRPRLELLRQHARFGVNVNAVLGSCTERQTEELVEYVRGIGFYMTVGLLHNETGSIDPGLVQRSLPEFYRDIKKRCRRTVFHHAGEGWEARMLREGEAPWRCRAGARYLYIDENGRVSYCSQRRGQPGIALLSYSKEDLLREYHTQKGCEPQCTLACVRRASSLDERRPQRITNGPAKPVSGRVHLPIS